MIFPIYFILLAIAAALQYRITLPAISEIKLQVSQSITLVPFPGILIDKLSVREDKNNTRDFTALCKVRPSSLQSKVTSINVFNQKNRTPKIISSLQQLKNLKNAIDMVYWQHKFYVIFKNGRIQVYIRNNHTSITHNITLNHIGSVSQGYFITEGEILLYVSATQLLRINQVSVVPVANYQSNPNFVYPYLYSNGDLFITLDTKGINRLSFDSKKNTITNKVLLQFPKTSDERIFIQDFGYDSSRSLIMVLDFTKGVYFFNINNNTLSRNDKYSLDIQGCQNMVYTDHYIYLTCPDLVLYNLNTLKLQRRPSNIEPEDLIITASKQIILKGSSHIAYFKRWQSWPIIEELIQPNRLIYFQKDLIYINDYQLVQQSTQISEDAVTCSSTFYDPGQYTIIVSSYGACDDRYSQGTVLDDCLYQKYFYIEILQEQNLNWKIILIGCILMAVGFILCCGWCTIKTIRIDKSYKVLVEDIQYSETNTSTVNSSNLHEKTNAELKNYRSTQESFQNV